jgi:DNA-binding CsgD family transcriptional regulator
MRSPSAITSLKSEGKVSAPPYALGKTGIDLLRDLSLGTHFSLFYETKDDLLDALVPYFRAGLERNEFCIWAVSEPLTEDDARNGLRQGVPGFDRYLAERSIEIIAGREWYLDGEHFDLRRTIDGWNEKLRAALADGYSALRISGNTSWLDAKQWPDFCAYERDLGDSIANQAMCVLCTYPLVASGAVDILEVVRAHQFAIAVRHGRWEFVETAEAAVEPVALTPRELEVLAWVARGRKAWEIAHILHIGKRTVDEHVQTATRKIGALNRTHAVAMAVQSRIIKI